MLRRAFAVLCLTAMLWDGLDAAWRGDLGIALFWAVAAIAFALVVLTDPVVEIPRRISFAPPEATPPTNVQIKLHNGTVIPVDCRYTGQHGSSHRWTVINPPPGHLVADITYDECPPNSCIHVEGDW